MKGMERTKTQFSRLLELDQRIRNKEYPNCLTFCEEWEVSQKTVQRDIDYLRDMLGAPIEYDRDRKGFYYTNQNWFLPSLSMSEGDLLAVLIGARALEAYRGTPAAKDLERVFTKLAEMLPDKLSFKPELLFTRFTFTSPPSKPIDEKIWVQIVRGLMNQRSVKIVYRSMEAKETKEREIDPYHIANLAGEWYVFARCHLSDQLTQFSVPRIQKATLLEKTFKLPNDFDPEKLLATTFGRFALGDKVHEVRLLFDKEIAPWVLERQWQPKQKIQKRANGDIELSFKVTGLFEVFRWVLAWGHNCKVLAPAELKKWVKDEVRLMVQCGKG
jgi:predicted DNA-binding transcriptional regulator YafY